MFCTCTGGTNRPDSTLRSATRIQRPFFAIFSTTLFALLLTAGASPLRADYLADVRDGKCDRFLAEAIIAHPTTGWTEVVVRGNGPLTAEQCAALVRLQGDIYRHLPLIESVAVRVPSRNLSRLAALPFVARLSSDQSVRKTDEFTVGASGADTAAAVPYRLSGLGVTVAVLDSGIRAGEDFTENKKSRIVAGVNFVTGGKPTTDDSCGHGTHVAGIIAGNGAGSTGRTYYRTFLGIAPKVNLVNVRVLDAQGQGTVSNVVKGVEWAITNRALYNIRVLNLSLGHEVGESYTTDPLCLAVEKAWKAGIVVVCSAGNSGRLQDSKTTAQDNEGYGTSYGSIQSPGNSPYAITVGAMKPAEVSSGVYDVSQRSGDQIATYSSRGPSRLDFVLKPDLVAPGNRVISVSAPSTYLPNTYGTSNLVAWNEFSTSYKSTDTSKYFRLAGTSMAAPVVSGAAALLLQASPMLTPDTIKARLMLSADKWGFRDGTTDPCTFGAGYLNIPAALAATAVATQYALSPTLGRDADGSVFVVMDRAVWGEVSLWGIAGVSDLKAVWGDKAIWGFNVLESSKAVWGKAVWGDKAVWGVNNSRADLSSTVLNGDNQ